MIINYKLSTLLRVFSLTFLVLSTSHAHGGMHGHGDYHHGGYHRGGGYWGDGGGYWGGGWYGPSVIVNVPVGGYYAPPPPPPCSIVQQCYPNGTCVDYEVCE